MSETSMSRPRHVAWAALLSVGLAAGLAAGCARQAAPPEAPVELERLAEGAPVHGFTTLAVYTDDRDAPLGGRFRHQHTGFVLDLLQIQSVPQAFVYVTTYPDSNRGEPHTQEHLLLGKGNKGRFVAGLENMSLIESSAYTQQYRTCYHFHTAAGPDVFFDNLGPRLDALLHPDYSDEEIRREVHHYGPTTDASGALSLEEKGTVYQEMSSTMDRPGSILWREVLKQIYGPTHPLALSAGGLPDAIREMTPEHIRSFHAAHYQLGNMGMILSLPREISADSALARTDTLLRQLQPEPTAPDTRFMGEADLPKPEGGAGGQVRFVDFPSAETEVPVDFFAVWPAHLDLGPGDQLLIDLFMSTFAGEDNSNLYRRLIDSQTRTVDLGATEVWAYAADDLGHPIAMGLSGVPAARGTEAGARELVAQIRAELGAVAGWAPGEPGLVDFNRRMASALVATRRNLGKFVDSPPGFGFRHGGGAWIGHLSQLEKAGGFKRSVTMKGYLAEVEALLQRQDNPWSELIRTKWRLLDAEPTVLVSRPSPALLETARAERETRITGAVAALVAESGAADPAEALTAFQKQYELDTVALEEEARKVTVPPFIDAPPLTLDDTLQFTSGTLDGAPMPLVTSTFPNMKGATVGLALRADAVPAELWPWLSLLPALVESVGVASATETIPHTEMVERLQNEILSLDVTWDASFITDRVELSLTGSGSDLAEAQLAVTWLERILYHADWRPENLPRIRDVVDSNLSNLRQTTRGSEESWVNDPAWAWRRQDNPLLLTTRSFLTREHNVLRLKWWLIDRKGPEASGQASGFLGQLAGAGERLDRAGLTSLLAALRGAGEAPKGAEALMTSYKKLGADAQELVKTAAADLEATLGGVPDASLAGDWAVLCGEMAGALGTTAEAALDGLRRAHQALLNTAGARLWAVGSAESLAGLRGDMARLTAGLASTPFEPVAFEPTARLWARVKARGGAAETPYVALVHPSARSGVVMFSAPNTRYADTRPEALLDYLSGQLFSGGGAHSLFMKTWGAGLAYSNGIRVDPTAGLIRYYAERSPSLPRTLEFVVEQVASATENPELGEYAIAQAFGGSRAAEAYESRAAAIARDLADGRPPEMIRRFREAVLEQRKVPDLTHQIFERREAVYGAVLPGYGPKATDVEGGTWFAIGPEGLLADYETWLGQVEAAGTTVVRLYPRDFWMTGESR